ncbi:hypothetical protein SAMN05421833_11416 [Microbispora rosea]|uniref:Uncharacterized protein n=1 Tax=Microbispora rosea TaxID=58117 RepID=A0A1N7DAD6_9ACTN|nr:hypothetical protein SAMN05421833_11416 [Microbispora rosea]
MGREGWFQRIVSRLTRAAEISRTLVRPLAI